MVNADDSGNDGAASDAIRPPCGGYFERGVGQSEGAEHVAHLNLREPEFFGDGRREDGDADAVQIG
jgi:hypothetical protein